jgi:protein O-mannosyl-transferase
MTRKISWVHFALLALALLSYGNVFGHSFLFDDEFLLQRNSFLKSWSSIGEIFQTSSTGGSGGIDNFYRPIQILFYLLVHQAFGLSVEAFHALNLTIHFLNMCLIYHLGRKLTLNPIAAFLAAGLWGVHPMHTEAVSYMSGTADPLATMFCLCSVYLCLGLGARSWLRWTGAILCGALALLSKESAIVLPMLIFVVTLHAELERNPRGSLRLALWRSLPFWILSGVYFVLRATALNFGKSFNLYPEANIYTENVLFRIYTFFATLPKYLQLLLWPHDLHMDRNFPVFVGLVPQVVAGALIFCSLLYLIARGFVRKKAWLLLAPLWFLSSYAPNSGILVPVNAFFLEHWLYLPAIAIFWSLARAVNHLAWKKSLLIGIPLLALLSVLTLNQNQTWATPITFYNRILKYESGTLRVHNNLGMAYSDRGQVEEARREYEIASTIEPSSPHPHHNLGILYLGQNDLDGARQEFETAVRLKPDFYYSYSYLAQIHQRLGQESKAREYEQKYLEIRARYPGAHSN